ncbi:MAG: hypothetical protein NT062_25370 [Proteobacteria bacterium]|nr:hypothetical protein [Pseudomonadota bacterium]
MRRAVLVVGILMSAASARADSLWDAELRFGYGVSVGGSQGMTTTRASPLTIAAMASYAFEQEPPLSTYGGLTIETLDRTSIGAVAGIKLASGPLRLAAGGAWIFAPATLWGATGSIGTCKRVAKTIQACGDVQLATYFAGTDLPHGAAVTVIQLAMGLVIDAP